MNRQLLAAAAGLAASLFCTYPSVHGSGFLTPSAVNLAVGGACPDQKCNDQTCSPFVPNCNVPPGGNPGLVGLCNPVPDTTKCIRFGKNPFARCSGTNGAGFTCSETSLEGCVKKFTGDQGANGCDQCAVPAGTCGDTKYSCTSTACGS